jgi:probable rRNA maturation factor
MGLVKIEWAFAPGWTARDLPVEPARLAKILKARLPELRKLEEWAETREILGSHPRSLAALVCGDEEMRVYNRDYRHMDKTTDVLSFPTRELEIPGLILESEAGLGDLILSLPAIERGAKRGRRRVEDEFIEVFLHGVLHLLGFDHVNVPKSQADRMRSVQAELASKSGVWPNGGPGPRRAAPARKKKPVRKKR